MMTWQQSRKERSFPATVWEVLQDAENNLSRLRFKVALRDAATLWENPKSMAVRTRETDRDRLREIEDGF